VRNVLLITAFILAGCEGEVVEQRGEVIYSFKEVKYINNVKQVTEMVVTEYKMETDQKIVTLEYKDR